MHSFEQLPIELNNYINDFVIEQTIIEKEEKLNQINIEIKNSLKKIHEKLTKLKKKTSNLKKELKI